MKAQYLLPHQYKRTGWLLSGISLLVCLLMQFGLVPTAGLDIMPAIVSDEGWFHFAHAYNGAFDFSGAMLLLGCMITGCSAERHEDEFIATLRLDALLWATYLNCTLLVVTLLFIYGTAFLNIMIYNLFSLPILFLLRFHYILYRYAHEEQA